MPIDELPDEWDPLGGLIAGYSTKNRTSLPASEESEKAVLGAILLDPDVLEQIRSLLRPEHFYFERHVKLYRTMLSLVDDDPPQPIDLRTMQAKLERSGDFDACGGIWYLSCLDLDLPDIGRLDTYVAIVVELAAKRELIKVAATLAYEGQNGVRPREAIANAIRSLERVQDGATTGREWATFDDVQDAVMARLESGGYVSSVVPSGLPDLDKLLGGGFQKGKFGVVAARPGVGKSAFGLQVIEHVACCQSREDRRPCGLVSIEMRNEEQVLRLLARRSGIPYSDLSRGSLAGERWNIVGRAAKELHNSPIYLESASKQVGDILAKIRKLRRKHGAELVVVDYLGLLDPDRQYDNRTLEIGSITKALVHFFTDEPDIACVALAQLNRETVKGGSNRRPGLSDLAESGKIEQDAYFVGFLWRATDDAGTYTSEAEFLLPKHRNGATGMVKLHFDGPRMQFRCVAKGYP